MEKDVAIPAQILVTALCYMALVRAGYSLPKYLAKDFWRLRCVLCLVIAFCVFGTFYNSSALCSVSCNVLHDILWVLFVCFFFFTNTGLSLESIPQAFYVLSLRCRYFVFRFHVSVHAVFCVLRCLCPSHQ